MNSETTQPILRFPEFSDEWEEKRLSELFDEFKSGQGITASSISEEGQFPVYGGNGLRGFTDTYTHNGKYLLIGRQGALCGNVNRSVGKAYFSEHAIAGKANESSDTDWLAYRLEYFNLNRLSESSAQPGLSVAKLLRLKLVVPSRLEQNKIASFHTSIDQRIGLLEQKRDALERYKKGVMQKLFSQEIRFKDENGNDFPEWEEKRLGDILIPYSEKTTTSNEHPILSSTKDGIYLQSDYFTRDIASKDNTGYKILKKDQLVFSPQNIWMGNINLNRSFDVGIVSPSYKIYDFNDGFDASYFGYFLRMPRMIHEYGQCSEVGASIVRRNLNLGLFEKIKINVPSYFEQLKISSYLVTLDTALNSLETQIKYSQDYKRGLLQKMFV